MSKPSIFSRDYEKIMRKRKKRRNRSVILLVLILMVSVIIIKYDMQKFRTTFKNITISKDYLLENKKVKNIKVNLNDYEIILKTIEKGESIEIVDIETEEELLSVDIKDDNVLIIDKNQNMYLINTKKDVIDLTLNEYINSNGKRIVKDDILKNDSNYNWHTQGKIINNDKIAYVTNVSSSNNELIQSVVFTTIENNIHIIKQEFQGNIINLYEVNENSLRLEIDGKIMYITSEG